MGSVGSKRGNLACTMESVAGKKIFFAAYKFFSYLPFKKIENVNRIFA